jgi:NDP-sugar pyrophosphorylase family protein
MMKALILAAGLGTRLRPYTDHTPKPLFPIDGVPLLDRLIFQLRDAGCSAIAVNTHHLHEKMEAHIASSAYGIPVCTRHEPEIMGTGGAIRNLSDFWEEDPFLVVNADILTDIDFKGVFEFHCRNRAPATLVLVDAPPLNSVTVDADGFVSRFLSPPELATAPPETYTFTGIQVLDPRVLSLIPEKVFYSSIDAYRQLITEKTPPRAYRDATRQWQDLGTPDRYKAAVRNEMASAAFQDAFGAPPEAPPPMDRACGGRVGPDLASPSIRKSKPGGVGPRSQIRSGAVRSRCLRCHRKSPVSTPPAGPPAPSIRSFFRVGLHGRYGRYPSPGDGER